MFTLQSWKVKFAYAGFGCLFGSLCTIMGMLASPVTAQKDKFGEIECTSLKIVDGGDVRVFGNDGKLIVRLGMTMLGDDGGTVGLDGNVDGNDGKVYDGFGGEVVVYGTDGKAQARLGAGGFGGKVDVYSRDGYWGKGGLWKEKAGLGVYFGRGQVWAADINGEAKAGISVGHNGTGGFGLHDKGGQLIVALNARDDDKGRVIIYGKDLSSSVRLGVGEHGGYANISGKGSNVRLENGAIHTRDKNGYRQ